LWGRVIEGYGALPAFGLINRLQVGDTGPAESTRQGNLQRIWSSFSGLAGHWYWHLFVCVSLAASKDTSNTVVIANEGMLSTGDVPGVSQTSNSSRDVSNGHKQQYAFERCQQQQMYQDLRG